MKLAPPEYPADVPCTRNIHLCRNLFDKSPGLHGSIAFRSSHLITESTTVRRILTWRNTGYVNLNATSNLARNKIQTVLRVCPLAISEYSKLLYRGTAVAKGKNMLLRIIGHCR
jgi:hypothetical protein